MSFPSPDDRERQKQGELWGHSPGDHSVQRERSGKLALNGDGGNDVRPRREQIEGVGGGDKQADGRRENMCQCVVKKTSFLLLQAPL